MEERTDSTTPEEPDKLSAAISTLADIAANGLPIGKNARLVAKVADLNHGDSECRPNPAVMVGVSFSF